MAFNPRDIWERFQGKERISEIYVKRNRLCGLTPWAKRSGHLLPNGFVVETGKKQLASAQLGSVYKGLFSAFGVAKHKQTPLGSGETARILSGIKAEEGWR